ncbi:MAG: hypothetical protein IPM75_19130 [Candidatus Competibacteraceae bacterium]|nr:hypothetical protein [Candidatus Competibacteraceae bacterium]
MRIPKLTVLAEAGAVRVVEAMPDAGGWAVWIVHAGRGGERREPLERQRGGLRVFATLDAVARCLSGAGLSVFSVNLGQGEEPP